MFCDAPSIIMSSLSASFPLFVPYVDKVFWTFLCLEMTWMVRYSEYIMTLTSSSSGRNTNVLCICIHVWDNEGCWIRQQLKLLQQFVCKEFSPSKAVSLSFAIFNWVFRHKKDYLFWTLFSNTCNVRNFRKKSVQSPCCVIWVN